MHKELEAYPKLRALISATRRRWVKTGLVLMVVPVFLFVLGISLVGNLGQMMPVLVVGILVAVLPLFKARSVEGKVAQIIKVPGGLREVVFEDRRLPLIKKDVSFIQLIGREGDMVGLVKAESRKNVEATMREIEPDVVFSPKAPQ